MEPNLGTATPSNLIYELPSILKRIDLERLFSGRGLPGGQRRELEVELGSGDGSFLAEYARRHAERDFIGVERLLGRIRKLDKKGRRAGLTNLRGVRIESLYFLEYLLPQHAASALHVYFPDPWPKRKHWRHRLIGERFPAVAQQALGPGGVVYLRTDDAAYFDQMQEVFGGARGFEAAETPEELSAQTTDFERDFLARGIQTRRAAYRVRRQ